MKLFKATVLTLALSLLSLSALAQTTFTDAEQYDRVHSFVHEGVTYEISIFTTGPSDWYMVLSEEQTPGVHTSIIQDKISPDYSVNDASNFIENQVNPFLAGQGGGGGTGWSDVADYLANRMREYYYDAVLKQFVRV